MSKTKKPNDTLLSSDNAEAEAEASVQAKAETETETILNRYREVAHQLSADVASLRNLWQERDGLQQEESEAATKRAEVANKLFVAKIGGGSGELRKLLETLNADKAVLVAKLEAAHEACETAEVDLHARLPLVTAAIQRLYQAAQDWLIQQSLTRLQDMIHPSLRDSESIQDILLNLASSTVDPVDFKPLAPRPCPWLAIQPLTDTPLKNYSKDRHHTLEMVCELAEALSDQTLQILARLDGVGDFKPPPLILQPTQKTPEQLAEESSSDPQILRWSQPLSANLEERFQTLMLAREQNKLNAGLRIDDPFRHDELLILAHSLDIPVEETLELASRYQQQRTLERNRAKMQTTGGMRVGV